MNVSMILSGGIGSRFGGVLPKQYWALCGKEMIAYSVDAMKQSALTDKIIIVAGGNDLARLESVYGATCIEGASSRNGSLHNGLEYIKKNYPECENVFITEAARPFLTANIVDLYYEFLENYDAVITTSYITDSLGHEGEDVTDRSEYYLIQAPEAFRFGLLYDSFSRDSSITATVQQLPASRNVMKYFDFKHNIKITYPEDLVYAEHLLNFRYQMR